MRLLLILALTLPIINSCTKLTHDCPCGTTCTCPGCCCEERCKDGKNPTLVGLPEMRQIQSNQN
jgi:hypothetical protein